MINSLSVIFVNTCRTIPSEVKMTRRSSFFSLYNVLKKVIGFIITWHMLLTFSKSGVQGVPGIDQPHKRFEYKYSFKPPYLAQKDGTVPFFEYSGNAIASEESVRITPSLRSQKGMIWARSPTNFEFWETEIQFRVTGRGRIGADGLAFWYTTTKGFEGPVFGSSDKWNGLALFFDSFDNDNKHNNPYIMGMVNDGTMAYDHQKDGSTQQLAGCLRDFRNKPFPVRARITYYQNTLTVLFHNGMSNNEKDFEMCMSVENVHLPKNGFFGVSAATGGLADDHDVLKLSVSSLRSPEIGEAPDPSSVIDADSKKIEEEFEQYQQKLKTQKAEWEKEHPDQVKSEDDDWENWMDESQKELQNIFQGQSAMKEILTDLHRKMDDIISRQERSFNAITAIQGGGVAVPQGQTGGQPKVSGESIRREEVNAILANQREIVSATRDIKNFVSDISAKTGQLLNRGSAQQIGGSVGGAYDNVVVVKEMKDSIINMQREMSSATTRLLSGQKQVQCPDVSNLTGCVSPMLFIGLGVVQLVIIIAYLMFKDSKETQAKKFY